MQSPCCLYLQQEMDINISDSTELGFSRMRDGFQRTATVYEQESKIANEKTC